MLAPPPGKSFFLFGPRGTGKTTWVRENLPDAAYIDLLEAETHARLLASPARLESLCRRHLEVHLPLLLIPLIANAWDVRDNQRVEHQELPQHTAILIAEPIPAARITYEPGVESEYLRLRDDLEPATGGKRTRTLFLRARTLLLRRGASGPARSYRLAAVR